MTAPLIALSFSILQAYLIVTIESHSTQNT